MTPPPARSPLHGHRHSAAATGSIHMIDTADHAILVAHDDVQTRCELALALRAAGFRTVQAGTGRTALKFAEHVSAALIHVHLPEPDAAEVCRILRSRPETARLPIVQVWAGVNERDAMHVRGNAADACVSTPVERGLLQDTVVQLLTRRGA